jgi:hypothetical protein
MKNLLIITLIAIAQLCVARSTKISFYFGDESSTLTRTQLDSIIKVVKNKKVLNVVGFANSIPNNTTKQSNEELALDRALYLSAFLSTSVNSQVMNSTSRNDQRVDIYIEETPKLKVADLELKSNNINTKSNNSLLVNQENKITKDFAHDVNITYFCKCKDKSIDELEIYSNKMSNLYNDKFTDVNTKKLALLCYEQSQYYLKQLKQNNNREDRFVMEN